MTLYQNQLARRLKHAELLRHKANGDKAEERRVYEEIWALAREYRGVVR